MDTKSTTDNELSQEHDSLSYGAQLHWFHWLILIFSGMLTVGAWYFSVSQNEEKTKLYFERESSRVVELVSERMQKYEDALWSGVAAIQSSDGEMTHAEWHTFSKSLRINSKYPGINGIGVVGNVQEVDLDAHIELQRKFRSNYRVHPPHAEPDYFPILYVEPEGPNAKAIGLDMAHESNRYTAAKKARDSGGAQITGPIVLVQDDAQTPGFLFYVPYYKGGRYNTLQERKDKFLGMVYAPFVVEKLMAGTLDKGKRQVGIRLSDGNELLYDEHNKKESDFDPNSLFTSQLTVDAYGRSWVFDMRSTKSFRQATENNQSTFILVGGIAIDTLLLTLFLMLSRSNRKTLSFANRMTVELRQQATQLAKSNEELESFAYISSHDLKTPLRGIEDLTSYIEEDLEPYISLPEANPDVKHNLIRLHKQVERMENLIRGILDYSGVGARTETVEMFNVASIFISMRDELNLRDEQLILDGDFPNLTTYRIRFEQVVNNLVGNAFKYHHDPDRASVRILCEERTDFYSFSVTDNGPGIDPKFHSRIFEVFQTLQSKDDIESTGVGLSIVKKSVEKMGGSVIVLSELGKGTTFQFEWPKTMDSQPQLKKEVS